MKKRKRKVNGQIKVSRRLVTALSILSIIGFAGVISKNIFSFDLDFYTEAALLIVIGIGLVVESRIKKLKSIPLGLIKQPHTFNNNNCWNHGYFSGLVYHTSNNLRKPSLPSS